jgi:hypothetical protein
MARSTKKPFAAGGQPKQQKKHKKEKKNKARPSFADEEASEDEFYEEELPSDAEVDGQQDDGEADEGRRESLMTTSTFGLEGERHHGKGPAHWQSKDKRVLKTLRHFIYNLFDRAVHSMKWEEEQIIDLLEVCQREIGFDEERVLKILERTDIVTPNILASISERGIITFSPKTMITLLLKASKSMDRFIHMMGQALEYDLFDLPALSPKEEDDEDDDEPQQTNLELVSLLTS